MQPARFPCGETEKTRCLLPVGGAGERGVWLCRQSAPDAGWAAAV